MSEATTGAATRVERAKIQKPNYSPSFSLPELLSRDDRATDELTDSGTFVDNGWDRWHYLVDEENGIADKLIIQPQVPDHISWWKKLEIFSFTTFGTRDHIRTLMAWNKSRVATTDLTLGDGAPLQVECWNAGPFGVGSY